MDGDPQVLYQSGSSNGANAVDQMVSFAYEVESHQVSKTPPTGEYITAGSFMVRGRKNFLPASALEMGLGMLFVFDNKDSVARHADDGQDYTLLEQDQPMFEEKEEGVRGSERRKDCSGKDNEKNIGRGPAETLSIRQQHWR